MKRTDGRKHWTQRPENKARLQAMRRKSAKKSAMTRANVAAIPPVPTKKKVAPRLAQALLVDLAVRGARVELAELEKRAVTLRMFLRGAK